TACLDRYGAAFYVCAHRDWCILKQNASGLVFGFQNDCDFFNDRANSYAEAKLISPKENPTKYSSLSGKPPASINFDFETLLPCHSNLLSVTISTTNKHIQMKPPRNPRRIRQKRRKQ
ncbi:AAEL011523-PA, partial [Aedes aegypti]